MKPPGWSFLRRAAVSGVSSGAGDPHEKKLAEVFGEETHEKVFGCLVISV
jgi:hypothetical protein